MALFGKAKLSGLILFLLLCIPATSYALVGTVDANDEFPFVVRLETAFRDGSTSWCSGVVYGHVLSTAAHCLYMSDAGKGGNLAIKVSVPYVDAQGIQQTAFSRKLYVPQSYIEADGEHHNDYKGAIHDIGYVVLDRDVLVKGYLHWGLELLAGIPQGKLECADAECMDWSLTDERRDGFLKNLQNEVGNLNEAKVRIIGYGNYMCADYDKREENCVSDKRRRFVELRLSPDVTSPFAPWLWCIGKGDLGLNPVQHGDSGGPIFIQALDGRWLYVGYTSRGSNETGCASSMFNDLNLWRDAISAYDRLEVETDPIEVSDEALGAWQESISRQFFSEWLRNENSPLGGRTRDTLLRLYKGEYNVKNIFDYYGRKRSFEQVLADKIQYAEQWPVRTSAPSSVSVKCRGTERHDQDFCTVIARLDWTARNANRFLNGQSDFVLSLDMPYFSAMSLLFLHFAPTVRGETILSKDNGATVRSAGYFKSFENFDLKGTDARTISNTNIIGCQSICREDATCVGYSFDKWNKFCFLKSKAHNLSLDPRSLSGVRSNAPEPGFATTPFKMTRYRKKMFPAEGYRVVATPAFEACELECQTDQKCVAFTYQRARNGKECSLLAKTGEYFSNPVADSGVKTQAQ